MAELDNRNKILLLSNSNNMLRRLPRATNQVFGYKSTIHQNESMLYPFFKNIYTTPVWASEQKLPKLPVPKLEDTLNKYLKTVKPLLSDDQFDNTKGLVNEFGKKNGIGEKLQSMLLRRAEQHENWLAKWWNNYSYLEYRSSVVLNVSPAYVFPLQKFHSVEERLEYTARLIIAAVKYKQLIDSDKIPIDKMGKDELDMEPHKKIFGPCRIPKHARDDIEYNPHSQHIVIVHNNHFYKMYPVDSNNKILSINQIIALLKELLDKTHDKAPPVGILTADNRDTWCKYYETLTKDPHNKKCVEEIQKSIFLVCLDKPMPPMDSLNRFSIAGHQCLHGGGWRHNSANRWFDKAIQFIIGVDGITGLCYEHSPVDGHPVALMIDFLMHNLDKASEFGSDAKVRSMEQLEFNLNKEISKCIDTSAEFNDNNIANFELYCDVYKGYGKEFIKSQKFSPDSYIQMAMQYAYYKMHRAPAPQYESAATRKYKHGRTETIRSCSSQSIEFAQSMLSDAIPRQKRRFLEDAINEHKRYAIDAVNGFGVDRHLLGLRLTAKEHGIDLPSLYKDIAFEKSSHFVMSTSQVPTRAPGFLCYGAGVEDGYGFCYNPRDHDIYYGIACFKSHKNTSAKEFSCIFQECLLEMQDMLLKSTQAKL